MKNAGRKVYFMGGFDTGKLLIYGILWSIFGNLSDFRVFSSDSPVFCPGPKRCTVKNAGGTVYFMGGFEPGKLFVYGILCVI